MRWMWTTWIAAAVLVSGCGATQNEVRVAVTDKGFEPEVVTVKAGRPATLVITRRVDGTCATEAVFAETGQKFDLPLKRAVRIPISTDKPTVLHYACAMDMYKGQVVVK